MVGVVNSVQLLPGNLPYRMASNNYYLAHARNMTMMALALDPGDDPPVNPLLPTSSIGNSARSCILDANGAWLYQVFAMMGDPQVAARPTAFRTILPARASAWPAVDCRRKAFSTANPSATCLTICCR